ncbi:MAG: DUF1566 domain-containing protein [Candidatus Thiothrix sulfatifontis]|nr:MAG: DUF1566 domain-containing protein [Candidatus Thiothrix sulfatifontis]
MFKIIQLALLTYSLSLLPTIGNATCKPESIPPSTPSSQFTDNGDGTVTDTKTDLIWKKCSEGQVENDCSGGSRQRYNWEAALERVQTINATGGFAGYTDWRVPNIKELASIVEQQCEFPAVNWVVFPNTHSGEFWSASPARGNGELVWGVDFRYGTVEWAFLSRNWSPKNDQHYVRLVRSGSHVDGQ